MKVRDVYKVTSLEEKVKIHKKRLYFDMDGVLVDFDSGLTKLDEQTLKEYEGR